MKKLILIPALLLTTAVFAQQKQFDSIRSEQYRMKVDKDTAKFKAGDIVTTTRLKENFSFTVKMVRWRNAKVKFEYWGLRTDSNDPGGWFLEGDLRRD